MMPPLPTAPGARPHGARPRAAGFRTAARTTPVPAVPIAAVPVAAVVVLAAVVLLAACRPAPPAAAPAADAVDVPAAPDDGGAPRLPTGRRLDPAGRQVDVLPMPLALLATPDARGLVLLGSGWRAQGVQLVGRATGRVAQTLEQPSAFVGLAWAPAGAGEGAAARTLYASGGNGDVVYRYRWSAGPNGGEGAAPNDAGRLALRDSLVLAPRARPDAAGTRYPAGLAPSPDGRRLYVAENLGDALAVVDVATGRVVQRLATERYPYGVAVAPGGRVFVSAWGGGTVSVFDPAPGGRPSAGDSLVRVRDVPAGRHPSALLLDAAGRRLFVASASTDRVLVLDARTLAPAATLADPVPAPAGGPAGLAVREGSTPAALALSPDGRRLFVAESDNNAVAAFDLDSAGGGRLAGRAPVGWYPTAVLALGDTLYAADGKGRGTAPNRDGPQPLVSRERQGSAANTTLRQIGGTLSALPLGAPGDPALAARVARANGWDRPRAGAARAGSGYPPFEHVLYVIKENRTYDQVFGDLARGDGDPSLVFFPRSASPNHHALAERFGVYDRFFVNAEVSPDGHNWSVGAYTTDYLQKTVPSHYSGRGRTYDYEGTNRGAEVEDDAAEPASGYLWDLARAAGATFRNYGEFVVPPEAAPAALPAGYRGNKPFLRAHTDPDYAGYDLAVSDQRRADAWLREFAGHVRAGRMPQLEVLRLPNDHTAGARAGAPTPRAFMADNDLALGRIVEALSRSPFWRSTVVFVVEDDAQNGPDHVDSHRAPFLVVSAWSRPGVVRRFVNTTDVLATIEEVLGFGHLSQFDLYGRPLRDVWAARPDLRPYAALAPAVPLAERNTAANTTPADRRASARLALEVEDQADEDVFNRVLWRTVKGAGVPYPGVRRLSGQELALLGAAGR